MKVCLFDLGYLLDKNSVQVQVSVIANVVRVTVNARIMQ